MFDHATIVAAVERCKVMASSDQGASITVANDTAILRSSLTDHGDLVEEIDLPAGEWTGPSVKYGFNPRYLSEALAAVGGPSVRVGFGAELDPILVSNDGPSRAVIMPMRVTQ